MPLLQIKNFFIIINIVGHEVSQSCGSYDLENCHSVRYLKILAEVVHTMFCL